MQVGATANRDHPTARPCSGGGRRSAALGPLLPDPVLPGPRVGAACGGPGGGLHLPPAQEQPVQLAVPERRWRTDFAADAYPHQKVDTVE
jgi:hypothetical protein